MVVLAGMVEYKVEGNHKLKTSLDDVRKELSSQLGAQGIKTEFVSDCIEEKVLFKTIKKDVLIMYNADHRDDYLHYIFCSDQGQVALYVGGETPMVEFLRSKAEVKSSGKSYSEITNAYNESSMGGKLVFGGVATAKMLKSVGGVIHGATKTVLSKKSDREAEQEYCKIVDAVLRKI